MHVCLFIHQYLMPNLLILDFNWSVKWWCRYQTVDVNLHAIFIKWWKMVRIRPFYSRSREIAKCLSCELCKQLLTDATKIIICFHTCENFYWSQKYLTHPYSRHICDHWDRIIHISYMTFFYLFLLNAYIIDDKNLIMKLLKVFSYLNLV